MRTLTPAAQAALEAETVAPRDFITIYAKTRDTGAEVVDCYWSDEGSVAADVIDPGTGLVVTRTFKGGGGALSISAVPIVVGLVVQNVEIELSQISEHIQQLIRGYEPKQARIELHRGFVDPKSGLLVSPAVPRFAGFIDEIEITTPEQGGEGAVSVTCTSHTQEITRSNPATRSDADQRLRDADDGFFRHVALIGEQNIYWGQTEA
jgi:hypothetical protein